jgi:prepilin-type N-terminal cleavage/methylation domain-containing protein
MKRQTAEAGFSLLETLVALIVLAALSGFLVSNSRTAGKGNAQSRIYGKAATATKEAVESLNLLSLREVSALREKAMHHSQGPAITVVATARSVRSGDVPDINAQDTSTLRMVDLVTTFQGAAGKPVEKRFTLVVYKP